MREVFKDLCILINGIFVSACFCGIGYLLFIVWDNYNTEYKKECRPHTVTISLQGFVCDTTKLVRPSTLND